MSVIDAIAALSEDADFAVVVTDGVIDGEGPRIRYVNAAFELMTGFGRDEVVGRSPRMLQGSGTSLAARKRIARALRARAPHTEILINYRKSGEPYRCSVAVLPVLSPSGELLNFLAIEREVVRRPGRRSTGP